MPIRFTQSTLKSLTLATGQKKLSAADTEQRGLTYELHPSGGYFHFRYVFDGRQRSIQIGHFGTISIADARQKAAAYARQVALGEDPQAAKQVRRESPLYAEFIQERYLPYIRTNKRSYTTDVSVLQNHLLPAFGERKMIHIAKGEVMQFLQEKHAAGYAPGTLNRLLVLLRYTFNLAITWEIPGVVENPARRIKAFKENNKIERYLSDEEALRLKEALLKSPNQMLPLLVAFLLVTGARKREALDARWEQFDLHTRVWRIPLPRSGKARHIPITPTVERLLSLVRDKCADLMGTRLAANCPWVFPNPTTGLPFNSIFHSWNSSRKRAGLPEVRIHDLRHTFASTLVNWGVPSYEVQKILGHQHLRTTERYAHLAPRRLQDSASVAGQRFGQLWELSAVPPASNGTPLIDAV